MTGNGTPWLQLAWRTVMRLAWAVIIAAAVAVVIGPILWGVSTSLKPESRIFAVPPRWIPQDLTFMHYLRLWLEGVSWNFLNSAFYTAGTVIVALLIGSMAGYVFSRFDFRGRTALLLLVLGSMTIPSYSLLLPTQILFSKIGLLDTRFTLILMYSAHVVPFVTWITRAHFDTVPRELEQAAMVDGYSRWEAMLKVVLPGAKPALIAGGTFSFLYAWNDYITATTMAYSPHNRTLPVALIFFQGFHGRDWGALMAGVVIATLPPVVLFLVFRRFLIGGFASGSVKG